MSTPNGQPGMYFISPTGPAPLSDLVELLSSYREKGLRIVTTNGCFDILHMGHVEFLERAKKLGDILIVGINSDRSIRIIKGSARPYNTEQARAAILAAIRFVDYVVVFDNVLPNDMLSMLKPDIHVKGGDYSSDNIPETKVVQQLGGTVEILPLTPGHSTSHLVQKILQSDKEYDDTRNTFGQPDFTFANHFLQVSNYFRHISYGFSDSIEEISRQILACLSAGSKILICGNGGSAADAQHFAAELIGRFRLERAPLPAIALTTDTSILTALGNDYGFDQIFARQIEALGQQGDILLALSTSGKSKNILVAVEKARELGIKTIALTGQGLSPLENLADTCISLPSIISAFIQTGHISILHAICEVIDSVIGGQSNNPMIQS